MTYIGWDNREYEDPEMAAMGDAEDGRDRVSCDEGCGALTDPKTLQEHVVALEHWRQHGCLAGCSHGR